MTLIKPLGSELEEYVRDESRTVGHAETISFPTSEDQVRDVLRELHASGTPVTVQGARTGLAAGAVPQGGHVLNLSRMDAVLGLRRGGDGTYHLRVQPGVVLANLRKALANKSVPTNGWDEESLAALDELYAGPEQFFPTDPTETSACIGGMVACNASGARSYGYGPVRPHVSALRVVLADGDVVALRRGEARARGRSLRLVTEAGRSLSLDLPTYEMPHTKNASGYYVADDMDALDLFVGSDGTLGVVTEVELALMPAPAVVWGVSCFFETEAAALDFTVAVRPALAHAAAIEYFDAGALSILRSQRESSAAFASLPAVEGRFACCVYVELDCDGEDEACAELYAIGDAMRAVGADEADTWVARTDVDRECQRFFRHAVPESVNMLIDERRRTNPADHEAWQRHVRPRRAPPRRHRALPHHARRGGPSERRVGSHRQQPPARERASKRRRRLCRGQGTVLLVGGRGHAHGRCGVCRARRGQDQARLPRDHVRPGARP